MAKDSYLHYYKSISNAFEEKKNAILKMCAQLLSHVWIFMMPWTIVDWTHVSCVSCIGRWLLATHSSILPGKSYGQRSLSGYSPWGHKELDTTGQLTHFFTISATWQAPYSKEREIQNTEQKDELLHEYELLYYIKMIRSAKGNVSSLQCVGSLITVDGWHLKSFTS